MFWEIFNKICRDNNTTPTRVIEACGIAIGSVTRWKNGSKPSLDNASALADYFGVTVDYLMGRDTPEGYTPHEQNVISAYRESDMQDAVDRILGIEKPKAEEEAM